MSNASETNHLLTEIYVSISTMKYVIDSQTDVNLDVNRKYDFENDWCWYPLSDDRWNQRLASFSKQVSVSQNYGILLPWQSDDNFICFTSKNGPKTGFFLSVYMPQESRKIGSWYIISTKFLTQIRKSNSHFKSKNMTKLRLNKP